jgi:glutamate-ammonia-ligase adenylyltransferase
MELTENIGNIALLKLAEEKNLIPQGLGDASAKAYRYLRKKQHESSLQEKTFLMEDSDSSQVEVVKKLWLHYFKSYW